MNECGFVKHMVCRWSATAAFLVCLAFSLAGCKPASVSRETGILQKAGGTATALIENAYATAIVLEAQSMATALVAKANAGQPTLPPGRSATPMIEKKNPAALITPSPMPTSAGVELVAVTTAADGNLLMIAFKAPPRLAEKWMQGNGYIIDEATSTTYEEIPSLGSIGPLFTRPKQEGKIGYVMLSNAPVPLAAGSIVTVVLGDFTQEHVKIQ